MHYHWDYALLNVAHLWMLAFDWACFRVMRRWGKMPEEARWVYNNATWKGDANEDHRSP